MGKVKYNKDGFWVKKEENRYRVGLAIHDVEDVGDISFVDLPSTGNIDEGDTFLNLEASKVVSEFTAPLTGEITEMNEALMEQPEDLKSKELEKNWVAVFKNVSEDSLTELVEKKPELSVSKMELED